MIVGEIVLDSCRLPRWRELWFPGWCIAHRHVAPLLILAIPALLSILGWITQLPDGGPDPFAKLDIELNGLNPVVVGIHELPPGSPSFRPYPLWSRLDRL